MDYTRANIVEGNKLSTDVYAALFNKIIMADQINHEFNPASGKGKITYLINESCPDYGEEGLASILRGIKLDKIRLENDE